MCVGPVQSTQESIVRPGSVLYCPISVCPQKRVVVALALGHADRIQVGYNGMVFLLYCIGVIGLVLIVFQHSYERL